MNNLISKYMAMSFEQRTFYKTVISVCFSVALACGKFVIGLFTDYDLCSIAIYTFFILFAKFQCLRGIKKDNVSFRRRNFYIAASLFVSSVLYAGFMIRSLYMSRTIKHTALPYVLSLALISFSELAFAIAGLIRTRHREHYYHSIKVINFCIALIAILTTQISIVGMKTETNTIHAANAYTGMGVSIFIALSALYILFAPKIRTVGREHNVFKITDGSKNNCVDLSKETAEITLCKSAVYGSYVYRATVNDGVADGNIERDKSLWKRLHISVKILCCILSEILVFVWLIGRIALFFRSIDLPRRLERKMAANGFEKVSNTQL